MNQFIVNCILFNKYYIMKNSRNLKISLGIVVILLIIGTIALVGSNKSAEESQQEGLTITDTLNIE